MKKIALLASAALFLTAPAYAEDFAVVGDMGDLYEAGKVGTLVNSRSPQIVITVGDNCYESTPDISVQVGNKYGKWVQAGKFFPSLGNHDYSDGCGKGATKYFEYFNLPGPGHERFYNVRVGNVEFFSINSAAPEAPSPREPDGTGPTSKQALFFKNKLAVSTAAIKICYFHYPPYSTGEHGSAPRMRWPFKSWGCNAVFAGHDHNYERFNIDGIPYVVAGHGGRYTRPFRTTIVPGSVVRSLKHGAVFCTVTAPTATCENRAIDGTVVDKFTISGTGAVIPPVVVTDPPVVVTPPPPVVVVVPPPPVTVPANTASSFFNTVGTVVHANWLNTPEWDTTSGWVQSLMGTGVRHIRTKIGRSQTVVDRLLPFCAAGGKVNTTVVDQSPEYNEAGTKANIDFLAAKFPVTCLSGIEGANEFNHNHPIGWQADLERSQKFVYATVKANPKLASVPVLGPSIWGRLTADIEAIGDSLEPYMDVANLHYYTGGRRPTIAGTPSSTNEGGGSGTYTLTQAMTEANYLAPSKPLAITETGYQVNIPDGTLSAGVNTGLSAAKYTLRMLFDLYQRGAVKSFVYSLRDDAHRLGINHGLEMDRVNAFKPRQSYNALKNTMALFSDVGGTVGGLPVTFSGLNATIKPLVFRKSDGSFLVVMYQDVDSYDRSLKKDIVVPPVNVTLTLGSAAAVDVFHPTNSPTPVQRTTGTTVTIPVADHVTVAKITF